MKPAALVTGGACWGRVVTISSSSAPRGASRITHYAASKRGVIAFGKSLALQFAARAGVPVGRPDTGDTIAAACMYLVSEEASHVTGQAVSVNGGVIRRMVTYDGLARPRPATAAVSRPAEELVKGD